MRIKVKAFAIFREILGGESEVELMDGSTVKDLLEFLSEQHADLRNVVFDVSGYASENVFLMRNRTRLDRRKDLLLVLHEGDEMAIFSPMAGG
ncbi:MAG: MoaD/ThiS family protein [Methanotrichaceae archaeon]|nr:MoaD/ThiS family protein [Methanotrichaceae archaeon]